MAATKDPLTGSIIGAATEVHRALGPGLHASAYARCLAWELEQQDIPVARDVPLPVTYKELEIDEGCRLDLLVDDRVVVSIKTVEELMPVHEAELISHLKLSGNRTGLIINFYTTLLKDGLRRLTLRG